MDNYWGAEFKLNTRLREVGLQDAAFILKARQESSRNQFLSPVNGSVEQQRLWIDNYLIRRRDQTEFYWLIENTAGSQFGLIRIYNIMKDQSQFTIGSWLLLPNAPQMMAMESMALAYEYGFHQLGLQICRFEVMKANRKVLRFHRCYADEISHDDEFVYFEFKRDQFERSIFQNILIKA